MTQKPFKLKKLPLPNDSPIGRLKQNHLIRTHFNRFNWMRIKHLLIDDEGVFYIQAKSLHAPYVRLNARPSHFYIRVEDCEYKQHIIQKNIYVHILDFARL